MTTMLLLEWISSLKLHYSELYFTFVKISTTPGHILYRKVTMDVCGGGGEDRRELYCRDTITLAHMCPLPTLWTEERLGIALARRYPTA